MDATIVFPVFLIACLAFIGFVAWLSDRSEAPGPNYPRMRRSDFPTRFNKDDDHD